MIAQPDSSADTMERALAFTIAKLQAAVEMDMDLTQADRDALSKEVEPLKIQLNNVTNSRKALEDHIANVMIHLQARVIMGDDVLDKGLRNAKRLMNLKFQRSEMSDGADFVFGKDISDLTDAELRFEPQMVMKAIARFDQVPHFDGKDEMRADLQKRAEQQQQALNDRDNGEFSRAQFNSAMVRHIADGSDALYKLEKQLLTRFPRERDYVRKFFWDVRSGNSNRKSAPANYVAF